MEELVKDLFEYVELYKKGTTEERKILKKIIYNLKDLSEAKKDNLWNEITRLGGTEE